jgi:hypothetical protein
MSFGEIAYGFAVLLFSYMTFVIIRGNFQRKFDEEGNRLDLKKGKRKKRED